MNITASNKRSSYVARAVCDLWRTPGVIPDAASFLARHPELTLDRSLVMELAYEEFCLRREAGESVNVDAFCARFPSGDRDAILLMLQNDLVLGEHPSLLEGGLQGESSATAWPAPGRFGPFTLLRELGRGSFSRVYLALEASTGGRPVAVKLARGGGREAHLLGRLSHDHIMPVLWAQQKADHELSIVCMPYLGSNTFADLFGRLYPSTNSEPPVDAVGLQQAIRWTPPGDPVPLTLLSGPRLRGCSFVSAIVRLVVPLAEALAFLHRQDLAHGDLKPANLLLTSQGRPLLLDFNLSHSSGLTPRLGGTPGYMAPEILQACLHGGEITTRQAARADLFSLGVILYEMLTGRSPFSSLPAPTPLADVGHQLLDRIRLGPTPAHTLNRAIPLSLSRLLCSCLALDPSERPASAAVLADALRRYQGRPIRRHLLAASLAGVGWVALALGVVPASPRAPSSSAATIWEQREQLRETGLAHLRQGKQFAQVGKLDLARTSFVRGGRSFRLALDLQQEQLALLPGVWLDYHARGRALLLEDRCEDARGYFLTASDQLSVDLARLAVAGRTSLGNPLAALSALAATGRHGYLADRGPLLACSSYCATRLGDHRVAVALGEHARRQGFRTAGLLHNLGFSYFKLRDFARASACFNQARQLDSTLVVTRFLQAEMTRLEGLRASAAVPQAVLNDVDTAILHLSRFAPAPSDAYRSEAQLYALASITSRETVERLERVGSADENSQSREAIQLSRAREELTRHLQRTQDYVLRCYVLGFEAETLCGDPILHRALGAWLTRDRLAREERQSHVPTRAHYLIDPLESLLF